MGLLLGGPYFPNARGTVMDTKVEFKDMESSSAGDSDKVPAQRLRRLGQLGGTELSKKWVRLPRLGGNAHLLAALVRERGGSDREGRHSRTPDNKQESLWCCQEAGKES